MHQIVVRDGKGEVDRTRRPYRDREGGDMAVCCGGPYILATKRTI